MKTKLLIFSLILFAIGTLNAHVITVSNNPITAGHFTNLQTAVDSANVGDTIYVMGSQTDYGNVTIKKMVTLIGAGYHLTGTQYNYSTQVDNIVIDSVAFGSQVSGTKIMGFYVNSDIDYSGTDSIKDVDIERCYVYGTIYVYGSRWTIRNNNLSAINCENEKYVYIQNNFIQTIGTGNQATVVISNNDFVSNSGSYFSYLTNALIANNVFWYGRPDNGYSVTGNTFSNNVTIYTSTITLPPASNTGANNTFMGTSFFSDATIPSTTVSQTSIWNYSWGINASSSIHNSGSDGTDPGVYGGAYPLPNLTGATRIPQMTLMNVGAVVPSGGNLNVNFKARKQN